MKIVFSPAARQDLLEIGDYIARDNPTRALSFVDELEEACKGLLDAPLRVPLIQELTRGYRRRIRTLRHCLCGE
jgi:plasmid stabilization system protein ParE